MSLERAAAVTVSFKNLYFPGNQNLRPWMTQDVALYGLTQECGRSEAGGGGGGGVP